MGRWAKRATALSEARSMDPLCRAISTAKRSSYTSSGITRWAAIACAVQTGHNVVVAS